MTRKIFYFELMLIVLSLAVTMIVYPSLPSSVATHWNGQLQADGYSPRWSVFLLGPGLLTAITVFTYLGPWFSPKNFDVRSFQMAYTQMMLMLFCAFTYFTGIILWAGAGHHIDTGRAIQGGVCVLFACLGNLMGKVRRNFFLGFKTPWALSSERVWNATHRLAAKTFVAAGLLGLAMTMMDIRGWPPYVFMVAVLIPLIYSLIFYKRLERRGEV